MGEKAGEATGRTLGLNALGFLSTVFWTANSSCYEGEKRERREKEREK